MGPTGEPRDRTRSPGSCNEQDGAFSLRRTVAARRWPAGTTIEVLQETKSHGWPLPPVAVDCTPRARLLGQIERHRPLDLEQRMVGTAQLARARPAGRCAGNTAACRTQRSRARHARRPAGAVPQIVQKPQARWPGPRGLSAVRRPRARRPGEFGARRKACPA